MRLVIIVSFFVLLCSLFDTIAAVNHNAVMSYDMKTSINKDLIPKSCILGVKSVSIVLFTKNLPEGEVVNVSKSCNLFNPSKEVIFLTHGFLSNAKTDKFSFLAANLIERDYTVFSLDWSQAACYKDLFGINLLEYPFAVKNTCEVGDYLASFIKSIIDVCGVPLENITLLGHSLGAHISSFAAKNITNSGYGTIRLLIGIEPAAPLFKYKNCMERFCIEDAMRVVVMHTSILGIQKPLGHADFWFNNKTVQSACGPPIIDDLNVKCDHSIGIDYAAVTLFTNCVYTAMPMAPKMSHARILNLWSSCPSNKDNCIIVDDSVIFDKNSNVTGNYCVSTLSSYPYCKKNDGSCKATNSTL